MTINDIKRKNEQVMKSQTSVLSCRLDMEKIIALELLGETIDTKLVNLIKTILDDFIASSLEEMPTISYLDLRNFKSRIPTNDIWTKGSERIKYIFSINKEIPENIKENIPLYWIFQDLYSKPIRQTDEYKWLENTYTKALKEEAMQDVKEMLKEDVQYAEMNMIETAVKYNDEKCDEDTMNSAYKEWQNTKKEFVNIKRAIKAEKELL